MLLRVLASYVPSAAARWRLACWEAASSHSCPCSVLTLRQAGSLASLHGVVLSLERFLSKAMAALEPSSSSSSSGSGSGSGHSAEAAAQQPAVLAWRRCEWPSAAAAAAEGSGGGSGDAAGGGSGAGAAALDPARDAAAALLAHLLDCWSEAGPSQLAEAPELVGAQTLTAILR